MTGQFPHNIDAKSRLFIPAKLREELGDVFHVTIGQDGCLWVFSDADWNAFMEDLKSQPYSKVKRLRPFFANASDCVPDAQGRILIPAKLRQHAALEKEVIINGSFGRLELWNPDRWNAIESASLESGDWEQAMEEMGL